MSVIPGNWPDKDYFTFRLHDWRVQRYLNRNFLAQKEVLVYGVGEEARNICQHLRHNKIAVQCFLDYCPASTTFEGRPVRSVFDLFFENLRNKYIIVTLRRPWDMHGLFPFLAELGLKLGEDFEEFAGLRSENHVLDATLGTSYHATGELAGFAGWGDRENPNARLVVTLGGSTTSAHRSHYDGVTSWSEFLYRKLAAIDPDFVVLCGGVAAYNSTQEFLKFLRDVVPLNPELVISYSGVNDAGTYPLPQYHPNRGGRPFISKEVEQFWRTAYDKCNGQIMGDYSGRGISFGLKNDKSAAKFWVDNMRMMRSISEEFSIRFAPFLQPCLLTGEVEGKEVLLRLSEGYDLWTVSSYKLRERLAEFYAEARESIADYKYITDLTQIFNDKGAGIYLDLAHTTGKGHRIIAEEIFAHIVGNADF